MFNDEMADSLRDLVDIDDLLQHFAGLDERFWQKLVSRASELNLERPAFYALRYAKRLLDSPVPDSVISASNDWAPPHLIVRLMDRLVPDALYPQHPDHPSRLAALSTLLLYLRSHWIRMPPFLLAYHLTYKFFVARLRFGRQANDPCSS